jgi:hypothetical protein
MNAANVDNNRSGISPITTAPPSYDDDLETFYKAMFDPKDTSKGETNLETYKKCQKSKIEKAVST